MQVDHAIAVSSQAVDLCNFGRWVLCTGDASSLCNINNKSCAVRGGGRRCIIQLKYVIVRW
jgi:hypothetical protein